MKRQQKGRLPSGFATQQTRQNAVQRVLAGESPEAVIRELGFHRSRIYAWLKTHRQREQQAQLKATHLLNAVLSSPLQTPLDNKPVDVEPATLSLSVEHLEAWILLLHQSLLDFQYPLSDFLKSLHRAAGGPAVIAADLYNPAAMIRPVHQDKQLEGLIVLNKTIADVWHTNPFLQAFSKPGEVLSLDEIIPRCDWMQNNFCRHITSAGAKNTIALCFSGPDQTLCGLFIYPWNESICDQQIKSLLLRLHPHLETAMALTINHWRSNFTANALEEATDHLEIAALVLDGNGRIIKCSSAAKEMLAQKHGLKQTDHRLDFSGSDNQKSFEQAVQQAIVWRREPIGNKPVAAMRFTYPPDNIIGVLVQAITPPSRIIPHSIVVSPHVVVYISDPNKPRPAPQHQLIMRLFNLSTREAHLTSLLADGHSLSEAAKTMNITQATARTYLQHIYEKVGVRRQQDLVQRVMKSVALLA